MLPEVKSSSEIYGEATRLNELGDELIPIAGMAGDQQASLFGQGCFKVGDLKNTYGTGCFMLMNTKDKIVYSDSGLLTTIAYSLNGEVQYALEGSVFVAGAAVQWLRDGIKIIKDAKKTEVLANASESEDVYFVPAFVGLGTPYWDDDARGAIFGLTRATTVQDLAKATLEAIAFQSKDVMEAMVKASSIEINEVAVDGGASANNFLLQFQANLLNKKITRPVCLETTALGAAYLAGLATGYYKNLDEIKKNHEIDKFFLPFKNLDDRYKKWLKAVEATRVFK